MLIFGITSLNLQNSLSSVSTLLSMCSKLCLCKCTRYSDRQTETEGNFIEGNLYLCTVPMCIKEQNLFYFIHDAATCIQQPRFSQHFFFLDISLGISVKNFELLLRCLCYHEVQIIKRRGAGCHSCSRIFLLKRYFTCRIVKPLKLKYSLH